MGQTIVGFLLQLFVFLELFLHSYKLLLIIDAIVNTFVAIIDTCAILYYRPLLIGDFRVNWPILAN